GHGHSHGHGHEHESGGRPPQAKHHGHHGDGGDSGSPTAGGGHDQHAGHSPEMFRDKFLLSLVLTLPVIVWAAHIQMLLGYQAPAFPGSTWISPVLGTAVFVYGGWVFPQ